MQIHAVEVVGRPDDMAAANLSRKRQVGRERVHLRWILPVWPYGCLGGGVTQYSPPTGGG